MTGVSHDRRGSLELPMTFPPQLQYRDRNSLSKLGSLQMPTYRYKPASPRSPPSSRISPYRVGNLRSSPPQASFIIV